MAGFVYSTLMAKCPSRIESIACWSPNPSIVSNKKTWGLTASSTVILFVGTSEGTLLVYELDNRAIGDSFHLRTTKRKLSGDKRPITKLHVCDSWKLLFSIAERGLSAHSLHSPDLPSFELGIPTVVQNDVRTFALNPREGLLCLGLKGELQVFEWVEASRVFTPLLRVPLVQAPRCLAFTTSRSVCVGYGRSYAMVALDSEQQVGQAISAGSKKNPTMAVVRRRYHGAPSLEWAGEPSRKCRTDPFWGGEGELVVVQDSRGCIVNERGLAARTSVQKEDMVVGTSLNFASEAPTAVLGCQPYLVSLLSRRIMIHSALSCKVIQTVPMSQQPLFMCTTVDEESNGVVSQFTTRLADPGTTQTGRLELLSEMHETFSTCPAHVFVATESSLHALELSPLSDQLQVLVRAGNTLEALTLCSAVMQHPWHCRALPLPHAIGARCSGDQLVHLAADLRRKRALALLQAGSVEGAHDLLQSAAEEGHLPIVDALGWFSHTPLFASATVAQRELDALAQGVQACVELLPLSPTSALVRLLQGTQWRVPTSGAGTTSPGIEADDGVALSKCISHALLPMSWRCRVALLNAAKDAGESVFDADSKSENALVSTVKILDSILLRAYMLREVYMDQDDEINRTPSKSSTDDEASLPWETGERKLEFLLGENYCEVKEAEKLVLRFPETWETLLWLYYSKGMHTKALSWLKGLEGDTSGSHPSLYVTKAVEYLQNLDGVSSANLILEYSRWIIESHPTVGLQAFIGSPSVYEVKRRTNSRVDALTCMAPCRVLDHLDVLDQATMSAAVARGEQIETPLSLLYLEHQVLELGNEDALLQNKLVQLYLETIMHVRASSGSNEVDPVQSLRKKLRSFIVSSRNLDCAKMTGTFSSTDLHVEYALLLERCGRENDSVSVFVSRIGSLEQAEEFCINVLKTKPTSTVFQSLLESCLEVALRNMNSEEQASGPLSHMSMQSIANLIEKYHMWLDPQKVLEVLPKEQISTKQIAPFIISTLGTLASQKCSSQVQLQLLRKENLRILREMSRLEQRHVVIVKDRVCSHKTCFRRFKGDSAFVRHPNGDIVHYSCYEKNSGSQNSEAVF